MVTTLSPEYRKYVDSKKIQRLVPETQYRYLRVVNSLIMFTNGELNQESILAYFESLEERNSANYIRWAFQVVRGFFKITRSEEEWNSLNIDIGDLPGEVEPERPYLETDEAQMLLELAKADPMDYAMFRLDLVTGIRKRELRELNLSDYSPPRLKIETKKHGERRVRTLDVETVKALDDYIAGPRMFWNGKYRHSDAPLFLSPRGNRMPDSTLTKRFRGYMITLGKPKGCGMHSLRRTCVTWEASAGMDSMRIQKLHGWKSARMPEIYSRLKPEVLEKESYEGNPLIRKGVEDASSRG